MICLMEIESCGISLINVVSYCKSPPHMHTLLSSFVTSINHKMENNSSFNHLAAYLRCFFGAAVLTLTRPELVPGCFGLAQPLLLVYLDRHTGAEYFWGALERHPPLNHRSFHLSFRSKAMRRPERMSCDVGRLID